MKRPADTCVRLMSPRNIRASGGRLCLCLLVSLLAACQSEPTQPSTTSIPPVGPNLLITDNVVATLAVNPDSQMVFVGDRFKITSRPKNAAGQLLDKFARWTVADPTIAKQLDSLKATTTFQALGIGLTTIKATVDTKSRSAKVVARSVTGAKVVVIPEQATVVTGGTTQFTATGLTQSNEKAAVNVTWKVTGGTATAAGLFKAGATAGTFRVIATSLFGGADTSVVTVTAAPSSMAKVILVPASTALAAGASTTFSAYGRTQAGDSVPATVTYSATGGTIATTGVYTAGMTGGSYSVIAKTTAGISDTSDVIVSPSSSARVTLLPDLAASRPGASTRFVAKVTNSSGQTVTDPSQFRATCGAITSDGVFTAPAGSAGSCLVIASAGDQADTTEVTLLQDSRTQGTPFAIFGMWSTAINVPDPGLAQYTGSHDYVAPADLLNQISSARAKGIRLVLAMTGRSHNFYKTNGVFDLAKWQAAMDAFDTPAIRSAVADAVADGTIIGNSVMDEPFQADQGTSAREKSWGPAGTMTKGRVDGLCGYVKKIFPTMPAGVFHDATAFEPDSSYRVCDFLISQYALRKGSITTWRDKGLALTRRDQMSIILSLNILDGGQQDKVGAWDCPNTGGVGTYAPNCHMTPDQIREWGKLLAPASCALLSWRYDAAFMARPENQAALSDVAIYLSRLPRRDCTSSRAPNTTPTAEFTSSCTELACGFTDESTDGDGTVVSWSWTFGDGSASTEQNPSHSYGQDGSYDVRLVVTDDDGDTGSLVHTVTVSGSAAATGGP